MKATIRETCLNCGDPLVPDPLEAGAWWHTLARDGTPCKAVPSGSPRHVPAPPAQGVLFGGARVP